MADSNALILLPPAQTAQPPQASQSSSNNQTAKTSGDETFDQKFQKAKKKISTHEKQQPTAVVAKPVVPAKAAVTKTPAKPVTDPTEVAGMTVDKQLKKVQADPADQADDSSENQADVPDTKHPPVTEAQTVAVSTPVEKKPVKAAKTSTAKTDEVDPKLVVQQHPQQKVQEAAGDSQDEDGTGDAKSTDGKAVVTAVGDDDGADDTAAGDGEFGTGKVVSGAAGGKKNLASSAVASDDSQNAANTAALAGAASPDATPQAQIAPAKTSAHPQAQIAGITTDISGVGVNTPTTTAVGVSGKTTQATVTPQAQFVEDNHPKIISSIQGQLLPNGGSLQMRLDPPELGALQVSVQMRDGVMTASFQTSNDDATKLLSHSLGQLKSGLEAAGVTVDKIHVEQAPKKDAQGNSDDSGKQAPQEQQQQAQQDQQRREMVRQMWRKLAGGDPLDLVA